MSARYFNLLQPSILLLVGSAAIASEPPTLQSNPFARPPSITSAPVISGERVDNGAPAIELRATMIGPKNKLANVAGRTVRPGDDVDGYTLVEVFEDRAVFARGGSRTTVFVKPELEEINEE